LPFDELLTAGFGLRIDTIEDCGLVAGNQQSNQQSPISNVVDQQSAISNPQFRT
jgi:hypothetical protein